MADFVIPVTPNMIDAARANNSLPCYEIQFEEIGANGQRQCRYKQFKETMPNGKRYPVLDIKELPCDKHASSEERRVGEECFITGSSGWLPEHLKTKQ